jgi:hypothetical protein
MHDAAASLLLALAVLLPSVPGRAQDFDLHCITVDRSGMVHVSYSNGLGGCAHLRTLGGQVVHSQELFCGFGSGLVTMVPISRFNPPFAVGVPLVLCWSRDSRFCTLPVVCSGVYGTGCVGTAGRIPALTAARGCLGPGLDLDVHVENGLGAASAVVFFGTGRGSAYLLGCEVLIAPMPLNVPLILDSTGARSFRSNVPYTARGGSFTLQAFVLDSGASQGLAASNGYLFSVR